MWQSIVDGMHDMMWMTSCAHIPMQFGMACAVFNMQRPAFNNPSVIAYTMFCDAKMYSVHAQFSICQHNLRWHSQGATLIMETSSLQPFAVHWWGHARGFKLSGSVYVSFLASPNPIHEGIHRMQNALMLKMSSSQDVPTLKTYWAQHASIKLKACALQMLQEYGFHAQAMHDEFLLGMYQSHSRWYRVVMVWASSNS